MICGWGRGPMGQDGNFGMTMINGIPPMPLRGWIVPVGGSTPTGAKRRFAGLRSQAALGNDRELASAAEDNPPPVRFVGMGEGEDDLADFKAEEYAKALAGEKIK